MDVAGMETASKEVVRCGDDGVGGRGGSLDAHASRGARS
jgi:hypothetical protein